MSDLRVTVEQLTIHEHPNADALELAQVGLYRAVVGKGVYRTGDYALYIPEQAVLPPDLIEEIGLTGRLAGKEKDRVKAIRLRGELSQGIVCRPHALSRLWRVEGEAVADFASPDFDPVIAAREGTDFAVDLGITKWVPPIPVGMSGRVEPAPNLLRWIEIENVKRFPDIFEPDEEVVATEKVHGTCCLVCYDSDAGMLGGDGEPTGATYVTSKGFGGKNLTLAEDQTNLYWRAAREHGLPFAAEGICGVLGARRVSLFGEVYGKGVQDLHYGKDASHDESLGYVLFDIAVMGQAGEVRWLSHAEIDKLWSLTLGEAGLVVTTPRAPVVYEGPYDYETLAKLAEGRSLLDPGTIREGVVVRPAVERRSEILGGRAIAKIVSEGYLLRGGNATEFE